MTTGDDELLRAPLSSLGLSVRVCNALLNNGFSTVGDVVAKTELEIWPLHYLGPTTLTEIKTKLSALGLTLRPGHRCPRKTRASEVALRPAVDRVVDLERLLRCSDCLHRGASAWVRWAETVAFPRTVAPQSARCVSICTEVPLAGGVGCQAASGSMPGLSHATTDTRHHWSVVGLIGARPPPAYSSPLMKQDAGSRLRLPHWVLRSHGFGETGAAGRGPARATYCALSVPLWLSCRVAAD